MVACAQFSVLYSLSLSWTAIAFPVTIRVWEGAKCNLTTERGPTTLPQHVWSTIVCHLSRPCTRLQILSDRRVNNLCQSPFMHAMWLHCSMKLCCYYQCAMCGVSVLEVLSLCGCPTELLKQHGSCINLVFAVTFDTFVDRVYTHLLHWYTLWHLTLGGAQHCNSIAPLRRRSFKGGNEIA